MKRNFMTENSKVTLSYNAPELASLGHVETLTMGSFMGNVVDTGVGGYIRLSEEEEPKPEEEDSKPGEERK
jgi:hypothetical protein